MHFFPDLLHVVFHANLYLAVLVKKLGAWSYVLLGTIVFCETGLVVTPFLPGDSLLFAAGSLSAISTLNPHILLGVVVLCAFMGDNCNYWIGRLLGVRIFSPKARFFKTHYLESTHQFYEKYGMRAILFARYIPLMRTFVPFVAGIGQMLYRRYLIASFIAACIWGSLIVYLGYFFGRIPFVAQHFAIAILGIIILSLLPAGLRIAHWYWMRHRKFKL